MAVYTIVASESGFGIMGTILVTISFTWLLAIDASI